MKVAMMSEDKLPCQGAGTPVSPALGPTDIPVGDIDAITPVVDRPLGRNRQ